jgi:hypothetical protein
MEAMVRCPLCTEEYRLADALAKLPPALIILEPSLDGSLSLEADSDAAPAFEFEAGSAPVEPRVQVRQPARVRKQKNVIVEFAKIVLGGILGLAIGQVLLWRMPGNWPAHQRDPFQFGQKYGTVFPISVLAPRLVRDPGLISESEHIDEDDWTVDPSITDEPMMNEDSRTGGAIDSGEVGDTSLRPSREQPNPANPGIQFPPRMDAREIDRAIQISTVSMERWQMSDGDRELKDSDLVSSLKDLAYAVTFVYPERSIAAATVEHLREFLPPFSRSPLKELLFAGGVEIDVDDASLTGEVIVGIVQDIQLNGDLFETILELAPGVTVPVLSVDDPRERFTRKDQVLMLAVWVTRPQTQLSGYDELPTGPVLYSDFPVRLVVERPANSDDDKGNVNSPESPESSADDTESAGERPPNPGDDKGNVNSPESSADDTESAVKNSPVEAKDSVDPAGDKDEKPPMEENETGSAEVPGSADSSYRL